MLSTRAQGYSLAVFGGIWFGLIVFVVRSNTILRETRLGPIARTLDNLPSPVHNILFFMFWAVFFLGWLVPVGCSVRLLRRAYTTGDEQFRAQ